MLAAVTVAGVLAAKLLDSDRPVLTDGVWIAVVGAFAAVASAWISRDVRKHARRQKHQLDEITHEVKNSHTTNLRDDLDEHGKLLASIAATLEGVSRSVGGLHEDVRILHRSDQAQTAAIDEVRRCLPSVIDDRVAHALGAPPASRRRRRLFRRRT